MTLRVELVNVSIRTKSSRIGLVHILLISFLVLLRVLVCRFLSQKFLAPESIALNLLDTGLLCLLLDRRDVYLGCLTIELGVDGDSHL